MKSIQEYLFENTSDSEESYQINEFLLTLTLGMAVLGYGFAPVWQSGWKSIKDLWDNHLSKEARLKKLENKIDKITRKERNKQRFKELKEKEKEYKRLKREKFKNRLKSIFTGWSSDDKKDKDTKEQQNNTAEQNQKKDNHKDQDKNQDKNQNKKQDQEYNQEQDEDFDNVYDWWWDRDEDDGEDNNKDNNKDNKEDNNKNNNKDNNKDKNQEKEEWENIKDDRSDDEKSKDVIITTMNILDQNKSDNIEDQKKIDYYKDILSSVVYDEDGKLIPLKDREKRLKEILPKGTDIEEFKKSMGKYAEQLKDPKAMESFEKSISNVDPETIKKTESETKERSKKVWEKKKKGEKISEDEDKIVKDTMKNSSKKEEPKKDSEGNIIKKETVTDKDGKKIKVITHTGPRGGKWYKNSEGNKTYVQESLSSYLNGRLA